MWSDRERFRGWGQWSGKIGTKSTILYPSSSSSLSAPYSCSEVKTHNHPHWSRLTGFGPTKVWVEHHSDSLPPLNFYMPFSLEILTCWVLSNKKHEISWSVKSLSNFPPLPGCRNLSVQFCLQHLLSTYHMPGLVPESWHLLSHRNLLTMRVGIIRWLELRTWYLSANPGSTNF